MIKTYEAPRITQVVDATEVIHGGKTIGGMDNETPTNPHLTNPAYPADE